MNNWSKSSLKGLLENCSWQWALTHIYGLEDHSTPQTLMGSAFHAAVEEHERSREGGLSYYKNIASDWVMKEAQSVPEKSWLRHNAYPDTVAAMAAEAVRIWWEEPCRTKDGEGDTLRNICLAREVVAVEPYFNVPVTKTSNVHGYIDIVHRTDSDIIVSDYKTASSFRRWTFNQGESIESSVYLYGATLSEFLPEGNIRFQWQVVSPKEGKSRLIEGPTYSSMHKKHIKEMVAKADVLKELDAYRPRPDWNLCDPKWCSFFEGCQVTGLLSPSQLTISNKPVQLSEQVT